MEEFGGIWRVENRNAAERFHKLKLVLENGKLGFGFYSGWC